jgi:hypothetical protein
VGAALLAGLLIFGWEGANAGASLQKQKMEAAVDEVFEDLTEVGVRHWIDVEAIHGCEHFAAGEAKQALGQ